MRSGLRGAIDPMLDENDRKCIVEETGALIRQELSRIDSRTRWHSPDRQEALENLITANNENAETSVSLRSPSPSWRKVS